MMKKLSKYMGYISLLTVLCLIYIANAHQGERKLKKIERLKKQVEYAKSSYQKVKSDHTFNSTESQLYDKLKEKGFKINNESPLLIDPES